MDKYLNGSRISELWVKIKDLIANLAASDVKFTDGDTFQHKYDSGALTGPKGDRGLQGPAGEQGPQGAQGNPATVNGKTGESITLTAEDVGALPTSGGTMTGNLNFSESAHSGVFGMRGPGYAYTAIRLKSDGVEIATHEGPSPPSPTKIRGVDVPAVATDAANKRYVDEKVAGAGGKRTCRFVVGTSTAGWTINDCDYLCDGMDDQVEINAAIQALPATGGEVVVLDGTYNITAPIAVNKANTKLSGNGDATVLKRMWDSSDSEGVIYVNKNDCTITNLSIFGNQDVYESTYDFGIILHQAVGATITGCSLFGNFASGIYLLSTSASIVEGNKCEANTTGVHCSGSNDNVINCNIFKDNAKYGIFTSSSNNNVITGNKCTNNMAGIQLTLSSNNNTVSGNMCHDNMQGIVLSAVSNCSIVGNTSMRGTGLPSDYNLIGATIFLEGSSVTFCLIANNLIMGKDYSGSSANSTIVNNKWN